MKKRIRAIALLPLIAILLTSCQTIPYAGAEDFPTEIRIVKAKAGQI